MGGGRQFIGSADQGLKMNVVGCGRERTRDEVFEPNVDEDNDDNTSNMEPKWYNLRTRQLVEETCTEKMRV